MFWVVDEVVPSDAANSEATWMGWTVKLLIRQSLMPAMRYVEKHAYVKKRLLRIAKLIPALEYRLRSIRLGLSSFGSGISASDIAFDDHLGQEQRCEGLALPLPAGRRVIYVYVGQSVHEPLVGTSFQAIVRNLACGLVRCGELVQYVKWDKSAGQCRLIDWEERRELAQSGGPPMQVGESDVYLLSGTPHIAIPSRASSENHWLVIPEVPLAIDSSEPDALALLSWSKRSGLKAGFTFYGSFPLRRAEIGSVESKYAQYMKQLLLADVIWPISEGCARDLLSFWIKHESVDEQTQPELQVLPFPCGHVEPLSAQAQDPIHQLVLSVELGQPCKHQAQLIRAFKLHKKRSPQSKWRLCLVGELHPEVEAEVDSSMGLDSAIQHLRRVSDLELESLYRSCAFTVFFPVEETLGLPIQAGLCHGKPCICADIGAFADVSDNYGCLTVNIQRLGALDEAVSRLIEEDDFRLALANEALTRPTMTGQEYARAICERLDSAARPAARLGHIYYWIDATLEFDKNTGIQRVSRQLAKALMAIGMQLIPVKWNESASQFQSVSSSELTFFSQWNGPDVCAWREWIAPAETMDGSWFFMPELPLNLASQERSALISFVRSSNLLCAAVFYDAIPWKMRAIYPPHFSSAHRDYMFELDQYDVVLPISSYSCNDLVNFLGAALSKPQSLVAKIKTASLPGEFSESARVSRFNEHEDGSIMILCVGTVEPRKNHEKLLQAFVAAAQRSSAKLRLVLAGGSRSMEPALAVRVRNFVAKHSEIIWEESVDDSRLRELHAQCNFTIYPSLEEGFGLPILESLWHGKPCICANFGAMLEVARGGGCVTVDVHSVDIMAESILKLSTDSALRAKLSHEAMRREFKSWRDYAQEIAMRLADMTLTTSVRSLHIDPAELQNRVAKMRLPPRPKLSICISTYNRAEWLATSLKNWAAQWPVLSPDVELLVCDNTSTDETPDVVTPYLERADFSYHRNQKNVGMLGNLCETANHARGEYIWILGDDDLLLPGAVKNVLVAIASQPQVALIYLNYAYTRVDDARKVSDFDAFFRDANPVVPAEVNRSGRIREICAQNENFFTAIYTLVFRRDHAIKAYSQDTSGRPFSTMPTCIPTTNYVLNYMMEEQGIWLGAPQLVVNMNVSWRKYAPLWILERLPEVYEIAEQKGASPEDVDRWRRHSLPSIAHYFHEIFNHDPLNNAKYFSAARLVRRFKHLPEFSAISSSLRLVYSRAHESGHSAAMMPVDLVFPQPVLI